MKTRFINVPFIGEDKNSIEKIRHRVKRMFPNAEKVEYKKPEHLMCKEFDLDFWTYPQFLVIRK